MNRFALLTLYRSLTRHTLHGVLNIGGLGLGIAVFLVLGLYVRFETQFERWLPDARQIYLVRENWTLPNTPPRDYPWTMGGLLEELRGDFPGLRGTRIDTTAATVLVNGVATSEDVQLVDANFFDIFALPMVAGDARALADPSAVILSEAMAAKYLPGADPIGKRLTLSFAGPPRDYRVAGVVRDRPQETDLRWTMLVKLVPAQLARANWHHWGSSSLNTYLRFPGPAAARAFEGKLGAFAERHGSRDLGRDVRKTFHFSLRPIVDVHLAPAAKRLTVTTLGLVGVLTLLIAIINYVNLATARAGLRAREVALRKVLGGSRRALVVQFLTEAIATTLLASLVGLALAELAMPLVNAAGGLQLAIDYRVAVPVLALLAVTVGFAAGVYPALVLSGFSAAAVLASARTPGGGRTGARLREALVVVQFALAIAFLIGTAVLFAQTRHLRSSDLGFARDGLVVVPSLTDPAIAPAQRAALLAAFAGAPGVSAVTVSNAAPGDESERTATNMWRPGSDSKAGPSIAVITTGPHWFETYRTHLLAGRVLGPAYRLDDLAGSLADTVPSGRNIVLTRGAVASLGFAGPAEAVGKTVNYGATPVTVVGVVEDIRLYSPRDPAPPTAYFYTSSDIASAAVAAVRYRGTDARPVIAALRDVWRRIAPQVPFQARTATQNLARYYAADDHAARLFGIGAGLAVLIGCLGLWGLAAFNTARRTQEIGIRKVLGASSRNVVTLLITQFLRPVVIANLIAWPLAWFAMRTWLDGFSDRIALSPLYFLGATLVAIAIAVATVAGQSLRAARATPAWALRHE